MTRLANQEKAGFYPTPYPVVPIIASYLTAPNGGRVLDPAAGEGYALDELAQTLGLAPYGVELHADRAAVAQSLIGSDKLLHDDFKNLSVPNDSFSLIYNNPPYLFVENKLDGRAEYQWLRDTRALLQPDGVMVYIVPQHMLAHRLAKKYLAKWFTELRVYRFPDGLYERFRQVVVFGVRAASSMLPDQERINRLASMGHGDITIPVLSRQPTPLYTLPAASQRPFYFRGLFVDPDVAIREAATAGIATLDAFTKHLAPTTALARLDPLTPLKIGHMNSVIAAGHLNNQLLEQDGQRLLIKGHSHKQIVEHESVQPLPGGQTKVIKTFTEKISTTITTLDENGELVRQSDAGLEAFLAAWLPQLTEIVATQYPPRYQFDLNGYVPILSKLNLGRLIPRVGKPGLLPAQAHAAAAVATHLKTNKAAFLVGEMGTGKTLMGTAIAACQQAKHSIVLCPPHLVKKWIREIEIVWPGATAVPLKTISDVDTFFAHPGPIIGVMKETAARSATGWQHAFSWFGSASMETRGKKDGLAFESHSPTAPASIMALDAAIRRGSAITRYIRTRCLSCGAIIGEGTPTDFQRKQLKCFNCAAPLYQDVRRRTQSQQVGSFKQLGKPLRGTPSERHGYGRYPLASYINRKYKRRLDLLLADECHQFKSQNSDRGYAFHRLCSAAKKVVGLTGTVYGGKASSLFHLLYRMVPEMRDSYDPSQVKKWVEHYGILQEAESHTVDEDGKLTGNTRSKTSLKELPGGSPAMLPWLLNRSVFVSLQDMGFALPEYEEIPVAVSMDPAQALQYNTLKNRLKTELADRLIRGDKSLLAGYLQALLSFPDSSWRPKVVRDPRTERIVAKVDGLPNAGLFPKEEEIIKRIQAELKENRKVLLLCQQTRTLDITPQWQQFLKAASISSAVLKCEPSKREAWIEKEVAKGTQVIISHPKRVETGLDLLEFPTIIWMGTEYSVYTVLQASRRSWRIGQEQPVKVYFFAYEDTLQEDALKLIAAKVSATLRVNGDTVADDSLAELDELASTDIVTALARIATGQESGNVESLQDAFKKANDAFKTNTAVIGNYTMTDLPEPEPAPQPAHPPSCIDVGILIPGTNLRFRNLHEWVAAFTHLDLRRASGRQYNQQKAAAIKALPVEMCETAVSDESVRSAIALLERARPPRGQRTNHPTMPLINALKNRLQHGIPIRAAPNGVKLMISKLPLEEKPKPAVGTQLALFSF